jgi:hypothetical protein
MGFLRRLFGGGQRPAAGNHGYHLYVRCNRCSRIVHVRIDLRNDLTADYGDTDAEGYTLVKEVMDDRCFRLMRAELQFDTKRRETSRQVEGGTFVTEEEWEAQRAGATSGERRPPAGS